MMNPRYFVLHAILIAAAFLFTPWALAVSAVLLVGEAALDS